MQEHTGTQNDNFSSHLIFEKSRKNTFKKCPHLPDALARSTLAIPELSEPEVIRHYTALSKLNFGMDDFSLQPAAGAHGTNPTEA